MTHPIRLCTLYPGIEVKVTSAFKSKKKQGGGGVIVISIVYGFLYMLIITVQSLSSVTVCSGKEYSFIHNINNSDISRNTRMQYL